MRSFYDSNSDGYGDFRGLASKLDYLQDLGVTAIWLLPFYPSPMRDDGYDIADYTDVHPEVGTLADFELFLRTGARARPARHHRAGPQPHVRPAPVVQARAPRPAPGRSSATSTSGATPPSATARRASSSRTSSRRTGRGIRSRARYFWHRFYAHQPDLNFENPAVHEALLGVVDFWFGKGVDGLRLDAVPYLYEAEGTNCENLPRRTSS